MKKALSLLVCIVFQIQLLNAVALDYWKRSTAEAFNQWSINVRRNANGTYQLITTQNANGAYRMRIEKLSGTGNLLNTFTVTGLSNTIDQYSKCLILDAGGNVYALVENRDNNTYNYETVIYKLDAGLNALTVQEFSPYASTSYSRNPVSMEYDGANSIAVLNNVNSTITYKDTWSVFKMDLSGNGLWNYTQQANTYDKFAFCLTLKNGKAYIAGSKDTQSNSADAHLVCLDYNTGASPWEFSYKKATGNFREEFQSVVVDNSGNCYAAGTYSSGTVTIKNYPMLLKINNLGQNLWAKFYSANAVFFSLFVIRNDVKVILDKQNDPYLLANIEYNSKSNIHLAKYSKSGQKNWGKIRPAISNTYQIFKDAYISSTNNFYLATNICYGNYTFYGNNGHLYRLDTAGTQLEEDSVAFALYRLSTWGSKIFICGDEKNSNGKYRYDLAGFEQIPLRQSHDSKDPEINNRIELYPNPATEFIVVKNKIEFVNASLLLFDAKGNQVRSTTLNGNENSIPVNDLPNGQYFAIIDNKGILVKQKFVVQK